MSARPASLPGRTAVGGRAESTRVRASRLMPNGPLSPTRPPRGPPPSSSSRPPSATKRSSSSQWLRRSARNPKTRSGVAPTERAATTSPAPPARAASTAPTTAPYATWSASWGRTGSVRIRGRRRPPRPRPSTAIAAPATPPASTVRRAGRVAASTTAQPRDMPAWTRPAAGSSREVRCSSRRSTMPAAREASSGLPPVRSACSVEGRALTTAATPPATTASVMDRPRAPVRPRNPAPRTPSSSRSLSWWREVGQRRRVITLLSVRRLSEGTGAPW